MGYVLAIVSDRRIQVEVNSDGIVDSYKADLVSANDYYPGGMQMPGRSYTGGNKYRYGFQNQEIDNELWESAVSFKYRVEDARLVRFFSVDPLAKKYPHNSPYAFSENRLIDAVELEGLESVIYTIKRDLNKDGTSLKVITETKLKTNGPLGAGAAVILVKDGVKYYMYGEKSKNMRDFITSYEGYHKDVYPSVEGGNPTGGVGHKLSNEETKKMPVGTKLSEGQIDNWFIADWAKMSKHVEANPLTKNLQGGQKEAMTDFYFNGLGNKVGGFKSENSEKFFLNFLGGDRGLLRRRIGQTILFKTSERYNFDFIKNKDNQKKLEELKK